MILKELNNNKTTLSLLDLLGKDENALSKAFAHLLSSDQDCYFKFLHFVGVTAQNNRKNFFQSKIFIQLG